MSKELIQKLFEDKIPTESAYVELKLHDENGFKDNFVIDDAYSDNEDGEQSDIDNYDGNFLLAIEINGKCYSCYDYDYKGLSLTGYENGGVSNIELKGPLNLNIEDLPVNTIVKPGDKFTLYVYNVYGDRRKNVPLPTDFNKKNYFWCEATVTYFEFTG